MAHLNPQCSEQDQVFQKYLDRAITEIHELGAELTACGFCEHDANRPALGTGHPLADVMLIKWAPTAEELEHGVAFHGPAGDAIMASINRLGVDPLDIYGTNAIKCATHATECQLERCTEWLVREVQIVEPRLLVIMGTEALAAVNALGVPDAATIEAVPGDLQQWTHTCDAIWCPDIDRSLERPASKTAFWRAFRSLGEWYADKPPF